MWSTFFRAGFHSCALINVCACLFPPFCPEMITSRLSSGPSRGPKSPLLSFSPSNLFPPPDNLPPILPFTITFSFACCTYPVIPEVFRPLSWQITVIPDRPWGIFGVFYMLTLKSYIWVATLEPCDALGLDSVKIMGFKQQCDQKTQGPTINYFVKK